MSIKIGNTTLKHGLFLAPMAGVTDYSFRKICKECGAEYIVSEMVSAKALCYEQLSKKNNIQSKTVPLARIKKDEFPMAVQIFGSEPEFMARAAAMLESCEYKSCMSEIPPSAIDINMGCPVNKIVSNGEGSAIMKNPDLAGRIVEAVVGSLKNTPVSVKIRAGWDNKHINAVEVAKIVEQAGASLICVHARTREQMYNPGINLEIIQAVKESVKIPVVGNGDIYTVDDAQNMLTQTGCDGLMIARGAMGNPWLFSQIREHLLGREFIMPSFAERMNTAISQVEVMLQDRGEHIAGSVAKKHAAWYVKGIREAAIYRDNIMKTETTQELLSILNDIIKKCEREEC